MTSGADAPGVYSIAGKKPFSRKAVLNKSLFDQERTTTTKHTRKN